jgi:GTP cyclohydrolase I
MNKQKVYITWPQIFEALKEIDVEGFRVYGIPKGGMIASGFLKHATNVSIPEEADIFLDDIIDSGKTQQFYQSEFPNTEFKALFKKHDNDWIVFPWEAQHPAGEESVQDNIVRQLQFIGEDVERDGLKDTPDRIVKSWSELYSGYNQDPSKLFTVFEKDGYDQMVVLNDIELYSTCEHHMLPFYGKVHVAYIPDKKVVGISKLARIVDLYARRLQIQERIGEQVTEALMKYLKPKGAACIIEASHMCMRMRGVNKQNSIMTTSSLKGVFIENSQARAELMNLIK